MSIELHKLTPFAVLGAAVSILLLTAGCGNNPYPSGESADDTVYRFLADNPKTMDPTISYDEPTASVIDVIYPSFLQYNYLKRDPFQIELNLGAEMPKREKFPVTVLEKGKPVRKMGERWTFHIKKGLHFQDDPCFKGGKGREIVAEDFLFAFRRMAAPTVECPVYSFFSDKILGIGDFRDKNDVRMKAERAAGNKRPHMDYSIPIEGLQSDPSDPYTFRIVLNQPYPQLRFLMAMHFTSPLAREAVMKYADEEVPASATDEDKLSIHPVGSGPYLLKDYVKKSYILLEANPNYREERYPSEGSPGDREMGLLEDAGKRLPLAKLVRYNIVSETITSFNQFMQGYGDLAAVDQQNYQTVMAQLGKLSPLMEKRGCYLRRGSNVDVNYFAFNMNDPVFGGYSEKSCKLRQAISLSIDSQEMIDLVKQGVGIQAQFPIPNGLFGYDPSYKNPYRQYDPELKRAKQLLTEAGYPDGIDPKTGKRLTLVWDNYATTPALRQYVGLVTRRIERLGINVESRASLYTVFQDKVQKGQFQCFDWGWLPDYPDPENFTFLLYGPNGGAKYNGPNYGNYASAEYDRLFEQMRVMDDGPERLAVIKQMRVVLERDCPWICTYHSEKFGIAHQWLHNYKPQPVANDSVKYWRADGALRAKLQREWNAPIYWPTAVVALLVAAIVYPAAQVVSARRNRRVRRSPGGAQAGGANV